MERPVTENEAIYAPVEPAVNSSTAYITNVFNRRAVFSDGTAEYRTPTQPGINESVKIRIRIARGNASAVVLQSDIARIPMSIIRSNNFFDFYEAELKVADKNVSYYFLIWCGEAYYFYNKIGVTDEPKPEYNFMIMPGFSTPDWAKGAIMYQIFTDRFCSGNSPNNVLTDEYSYIGGHSVQVFDWNKTPDADGVREFYGGDLNGVRSKLDYLQELGVEVIYFNPLFVSPSNHKYDIQDYDYIDPHFTTIPYDSGELLRPEDNDNSHAYRYIQRVTDKRNLEASNRFFAEFVEEVHSRGMKVILDGVFNHCGSFNKWLDRQLIYDESKGYKKGAYRDADSPYRSYFKFHGGEWPNNGAYEGWWGHDTLPKLNYEESPILLEYILRIARKWVSPPYNVDGWRLDVAADLGFSEDFNHKFWKAFRRVVKDANPNALIIAENYADSWKWLQGGEWDTIMNYEAFMEPITWFLTGMEKHSDGYRGDLYGNSDAFFGAMLHHMSRMNSQSLYTAMNELSNHDHSRFMTRTNGKVGRLANLGAYAAEEGIRPQIMREAVVIQMTWPGAPCIYYGDEAGVCGWTDPDNRRTYPWGREDFSLIRFHRELIRIHKSYETLRTGSIKFLGGRQGIICYGRFAADERIVVAVNNNSSTENVDIPVWEIGSEDSEAMVRLVQTDIDGYGFEAAVYRVEHGVIRLRMKPYAAIVMKNLPSYLM